MRPNLIGRFDPRSRTPATGNYYHIALRGNRHHPLFTAPADRRALNRFAIDALLSFDAALHAYCLMPHHFRFLVQMDERRLVKAVRRIVRRYSRYLERTAMREGPYFERPYEARRIGTGGDFLACLRNIHLGPVVGNLVATADDYRWSSHRAYLGYRSVAWVRTEFGLSLLSPDLTRARNLYPDFIAGGSMQVEHDATHAIVDRLIGSNPEDSPSIATAPEKQTALSSMPSPNLPIATSLGSPLFRIGDEPDTQRSRFLAIY
jgi:REP element-mobilizing transposase RayT